MALGNVGSMAVALLGDMKDFDRKMDGATKKVSKFDKTVAKMGASVTKYAKAAALAATAAVTAFGISAVKTFVEFDTGMREVFTLMPELSAEAREAMTEDVKALSEEIAVLPTEVIPALYQAISAGVPRENVFTFLEIAGKAAIGGVTELEVAVDGLTSVTNAYGEEVISVQEVADIMFTTVKEGKTTFDELSARLFQAVPVAAKIGLEFHNIAAAAAQITLAGVPMRVAMTQIRSLLNEVAFEGKELNKVFQEASGMTFPQYIDSGGDIAGIIEILQGAADKAGISIAELTSNLEAQGALLNLSGVALGNLKEILDEMANSAGAADKAYEEMAAGVQYQINQLKVWWQNLRLDIGEDLTESLEGLLDWLEENREAIGNKIKGIFDGLISGMEWLQKNAGLVKAALITIAAGFTALLAVANPVAAALVSVVAAFSWFEAEGGIAGVYDELQDLARGFRDLILGVDETKKPTEELIELWGQAQAVAGEQKDAIAEINRLLAEYRASEKQTADEVEGFMERVTVATDGFAESQITAVEEVMRVFQEWRDLQDEIATSLEQMWESIKGNTASALVDMVNDFIDFSDTRESEEETHQEELQRIRDEYAEGSQEALETALGIAESEYEAHRTTVGGVLRDMFGDFTTFLSDELLALAAAEAVKAAASLLSLNLVAAGAHGLAAGRYLVGAAAVGVLASSIPGYEEGGLIPGPPGASQIIMGHGGEEVVTEEQQADRAIDYERMGEAVHAGTYDAMKDIAGEGESGGGPSRDFLTKLAQDLYDPLQVETERRGGTV